MNLNFLKVMSYEEELSKIDLDENLKKYYQENPEKKDEFLKRIYSLRERIVNDEEIGNYYKKSFLSSIEENLKYLNETNSKILDAVIPLFIFLLGFLARGKAEDFFQNYNKKIASDITQTIEEELKCLYEQR